MPTVVIGSINPKDSTLVITVSGTHDGFLPNPTVTLEVTSVATNTVVYTASEASFEFVGFSIDITAGALLRGNAYVAKVTVDDTKSCLARTSNFTTLS